MRVPPGPPAPDARARVVVPTATLAEHLQNQLAREGYVFRGGLIQTLSRFLDPWTAGLPEVPSATLHLIVEEAARRVDRPEFARVVQLPGFNGALTRTISELSSAGCDAALLARQLTDLAKGAPLAAGFLAVYREVERDLARRGLWLRAQRLTRAAERIREHGAGGITAIRFEGFHALPAPELEVVAALGQHAEVTVAEPNTSAHPALQLVRAPNIEREADEIARRILEQAAAGRPFREIGIIVRSADAYVPILRSTLERFGIPARFYFDEPLEQHAAARYLSGAVDAMLAGWDHATTLAVLRLAPRYADSAAMDRFDFQIREQIPNAGLDALRGLQPASHIAAHLDRLAALDTLRGLTHTPGEWAARLRGLRSLFRPSTIDAPDRTLVRIFRGQAAALDAFDRSLDEAAAALDPADAIPLEAFWRAVKAVLRLQPLRVADDRRNVVHVLSAPEARQWSLPVVFVCGMVEKQFPQVHRADIFFPESARMRLNAAGIRIRTAAEFEREERALFDIAISRATILTTLSYPEFDARGDRNLPSLFLEDRVLEPRPAIAARPQPRCLPTPARPAEIHAPALLGYLRARTATVSPSGLETYLQCAFQFFARRTLRLHTAPPRPQERLDFLTQGMIVHEVLAHWFTSDRDADAIFEEVFAHVCAERHIHRGYHTERLRNAMTANLQEFLRTQVRDGTALTEQPFTFRLDESTAINGKIDRVDPLPGGMARIVDYKYSASVKARRDDPNALQAPLYLLGAERDPALALKPAAMSYIGLKGGVDVVGWEFPFEDGFFENALARTGRAVAEIREGRIVPEPSNPDKCRYCECRDACRIGVTQAMAAAEGA